MARILRPASESSLLNPQWVSANQRGEIAPDQEQRLGSMAGWVRGIGLVFVLVVFFIPLTGILLTLLSDSRTEILLVIGLIVLIMVTLMGAFGVSLWRIWQNFMRIKRDRENRAIRQGQGQLVFGKNGYSLQSGDRELILSNQQGTGGLVPGATYRVYFLEESGVALSAEEMFPANPSQVRNALLETLASANRFNIEDLEQNRNGEVTQTQRLKPISQVLFGGFFMLIALTFGVLVWSLNGSTREPPATLLIPGIFLAVFLLIGAYMAANAFIDIFISQVERVEGPGHKEKRVSGGKNRTVRYYYIINGKDFQVSKTAFGALIDGLEYRAYYLPRTKRLLTLEPIDVMPDSSRYNFNIQEDN